MVLVEQQYKHIRRKLDEMGYHQPCSVESVLLVDRLLSELICARDKIVLNEDIAHKAMKNYEQVENSLEFIKKENSRLIKENNRINLEATKYKDESEKKIKTLINRITDLENSYSDLEFNYMEQMANLAAIRQELQEKTDKLHELGVPFEDYDKKLRNIEKTRPKINIYSKDNSQNNENEYLIESYKTKLHQLLDENEILKSQLQLSEREVARLEHELEKRDTIGTFRADKCFCHSIKSSNFPKTQLTMAEMYAKIKIAQDKQHEAMERAVNLADQIQVLEEELVKLKFKNDAPNKCACESNVTFLKVQYADTLNKVKDMEERITDLQSRVNNLSKEKEEAKDKIIALEKDKQKLNDKQQEFRTIEKDMIAEIDKLHTKIATQRDEIAALVAKDDTLHNHIKHPTTSTNKSKHTKDKENITNNNKENQCEKLKAERDYYCNELHRLQEKVYSGEHLHVAKCQDHSEDITGTMKKIKSQLHFVKEENKRYQDEISALKYQLKEFSNYKFDTNKLLDVHIKKLESDNAALVSSNNTLKRKLHNAEGTLEQLNRKERLLNEELDNYKVKYNFLKKHNLQLELSLKNRDAIRKQAEADLTHSMNKLSELEKQLKSAKEEISILKKEKQKVRENLLKLDSEKDELLLKLDEKAIRMSKMDKDLQSKSSQLIQIENKKCELQSQLETVEKMSQAAEERYRICAQDNRKLEQELIALHKSKENLHFECESLKKELEAVSQDVILTNQALEKSRRESENLKRELQTYVDEVRRVEKILLEKEREREMLLEQFNALSAEASHLESQQQNLECEANLSKDNLRDTTEKLNALQQDATAKDSLVTMMKSQMQQLSDQVIQLQQRLTEMSDREFILSSDLEAARNLCTTLEDQKQYYGVQLSQIESNEQILRNELRRLECENETLHHQLNTEQRSNSSLEKIISSTRHETMEKCLYNEDLAKEVSKMKDTITTLESKLNSVRSALKECQKACADYHTENIDLKRQLTNERYERAKDLDSNSTSL